MNGLLRVQATPARNALSSIPARNGFLQRKCTCGDTPAPTGECEACRTKNLQRKLKIGASNDPLEMEADRIADQVLAAPMYSEVKTVPPLIQRYAGQTSERMDTAPANVDRVLASSGRPLEPALRRDMERRLGHDFSRVRVHMGADAAQSARDVNAHAYTVGHSIVFGADQFAPMEHAGRRLIAHELAHVLQQSGSGDIAVGAPSLSITGQPARPPATTPGTRLQRDKDAGAAQRPKPRMKYKYRANRFRPSTGIGHFDAVEYNSETEILAITVRPQFNFKIRIDDYPSEVRNDPAARRQLEETLAARKRAFIAAFSVQAESWGGHHVFHCHETGLEGVKARVRIEVEEVKENEPIASDYSYTNVTVVEGGRDFRPHAAGTGSLQLDISDDVDMAYDPKTKAMLQLPAVPPLDLRQPGEFGSSPGGLAGLAEARSTPRQGQYTSMHELGHLFGYGDEYIEKGKAGYAKGDPVTHGELVRRELGTIVKHGSNPKSIMSMGNEIGPEHGVTFLEALRSVTGLAWGFEPRPPNNQ